MFIRHTIIGLFLFGVLAAPLFAFAQPSFLGPLVPCGQSCVADGGGAGIRMCTTCDLVALVQRIINFLIFAAVFVATLIFVHAGWLMITSGGNSGQLSRAKDMLWNVFIGMLIVLTAWLVVNVIMYVLYKGSFGTDGWRPWNMIICDTNEGSLSCTPLERPVFETGEVGGFGEGTVEHCFVYVAGDSSMQRFCESSLEACTSRRTDMNASTFQGGNLSSCSPDFGERTARAFCLATDGTASDTCFDDQQDCQTARLAAGAASTGVVCQAVEWGVPSGGADTTLPAPTNGDAAVQATLARLNHPVEGARIREALAAHGQLPPGLDEKLVAALIQQESGGNPSAVSPAGAVGLMQILPSSARSLDPSLRNMSDAEIVTYLQDPDNNVRVGVLELNRLFNHSNTGGDVSHVLAAYNSGVGTGTNPSTGTRGGLSPSQDCPGMLSYQCHINPGGLDETRQYVSNINNIITNI